MKSTTFHKLKKEIAEEKKELELLENSVEKIRESLLEKIPPKFSKRYIVNSFFGSLILGLTFVLKGGTIEASLNLEYWNLIMLIFATIFILFLEIYFISYLRVKKTKSRDMKCFIAKRLFALYSITIVTTLGLIFLLNLNSHPLIGNDLENIVSLLILNSFPCAIGAAVPSLLKKY